MLSIKKNTKKEICLEGNLNVLLGRTWISRIMNFEISFSWIRDFEEKELLFLNLRYLVGELWRWSAADAENRARSRREFLLAQIGGLSFGFVFT